MMRLFASRVPIKLSVPVFLTVPVLVVSALLVVVASKQGRSATNELISQKPYLSAAEISEQIREALARF